MIKKIVKDEFFLKQKSTPATKADQQVAIDLLDTLKANEAGCVGLAANMIGVPKAIIVGHRDLNPQKACPCFDAISEFTSELFT